MSANAKAFLIIVDGWRFRIKWGRMDISWREAVDEKNLWAAIALPKSWYLWRAGLGGK